MFVLFPFYAIASILFMLLTWVLAPLLALTADADGNLPVCLAWFQTFDATLDAGRAPAYGFTGSDWWVRTRWLWRNPGYTFDLDVLGVHFVPSAWRVHAYSPTFFFATCTCGAFNLNLTTTYFRIKLGWKAWNHFDTNTKTFVPGNWAAFSKIPVVFTISR